MRDHNALRSCNLQLTTALSRERLTYHGIFYSHSHRQKKHWPRYVTAIAKIREGLDLMVTSLHLSHRKETTRMGELNMIEQDLHDKAKEFTNLR